MSHAVKLTRTDNHAELAVLSLLSLLLFFRCGPCRHCLKCYHCADCHGACCFTSSALDLASRLLEFAALIFRTHRPKHNEEPNLLFQIITRLFMTPLQKPQFSALWPDAGADSSPAMRWLSSVQASLQCTAAPTQAPASFVSETLEPAASTGDQLMRVGMMPAMLTALLSHHDSAVKGACARVMAEGVRIAPLAGISFLSQLMFQIHQLAGGSLSH